MGESPPFGLSQANTMLPLRDARRRKPCATVPARWWSSAVLGSSVRRSPEDSLLVDTT